MGYLLFISIIIISIISYKNNKHRLDGIKKLIKGGQDNE